MLFRIGNDIKSMGVREVGKYVVERSSLFGCEVE
jgi:hypothetical protein